MADVFISYKRRMRPQVEHLAAALRALKLQVWFDARLEPGVSFSAEIAQEVRAAKCVLVCWTNDCFPHGGDVNGWVLGEASIGRERGVAVPILLEEAMLDPPWNTVHTEDLSDWAKPDGLGPIDAQSWRDVLTSIGRKVGRPGLAAYALASGKGTPEALKFWAQTFRDDPLCEEVWARVEALELDEMRRRLAAERVAAPGAPGPARERAARVDPQPAVSTEKPADLPRRGLGSAQAASLSLTALLLGFAAGWLFRGPAAEGVAEAPASLTARQIAAEVVGVWGPVAENGRPDCSAEGQVAITLTSGGLNVAGQDEVLSEVAPGGAVTTFAPDGAAYTYRREGMALRIGAAGDAGTLEYLSCA